MEAPPVALSQVLRRMVLQSSSMNRHHAVLDFLIPAGVYRSTLCLKTDKRLVIYSTESNN
jgi:hypothetical protein